MAEMLIDRAGLRVSREAAEALIVFHCEPGDAAAAGEALGIALPSAMLRSQASGQWRALHLAPDEWLLIGPKAQGAELAARSISPPHSLVDASERNLTLRLEDAAAPALLNAACPLDLSTGALPPGACSRTVLGKIPVMIERSPDGDCFRMQYTRSYDEYVTSLIRTAAQDLP